MQKVSSRSAGFTLVELMVVVAVMGVLAASILYESATERQRRTMSNGRKAMTNTLQAAVQEATAIGRTVAVHVGARKIETFVWNDSNGNGQIEVPDLSANFTDNFGEVAVAIRRESLDGRAQAFNDIELTDIVAGGPPVPGGCNDLDGNRDAFALFHPAGFMTNSSGVPCMFFRIYVRHLVNPGLWGMIEILPTGQMESFDGF